MVHVLVGIERISTHRAGAVSSSLQLQRANGRAARAGGVAVSNGFHGGSSAIGRGLADEPELSFFRREAAGVAVTGLTGAVAEGRAAQIRLRMLID